MDEANNESTEAIAADVLRVLAGRGFFGKLDDRLCPADESDQADRCEGKYKISQALLGAMGFADQDLDDILHVLQSRGGFCDCEILYNVSEANRLKKKYWQNVAAGLNAPTPHDASGKCPPG